MWIWNLVLWHDRGQRNPLSGQQRAVAAPSNGTLTWLIHCLLPRNHRTLSLEPPFSQSALWNTRRPNTGVDFTCQTETGASNALYSTEPVQTGSRRCHQSRHDGIEGNPRFFLPNWIAQQTKGCCTHTHTSISVNKEQCHLSKLKWSDNVYKSAFKVNFLLWETEVWECSCWCCDHMVHTASTLSHVPVVLISVFFSF